MFNGLTTYHLNFELYFFLVFTITYIENKKIWSVKDNSIFKK